MMRRVNGREGGGWAERDEEYDEKSKWRKRKRIEKGEEYDKKSKWRRRRIEGGGRGV